MIVDVEGWMVMYFSSRNECTGRVFVSGSKSGFWVKSEGHPANRLAFGLLTTCMVGSRVADI